MATYKEEQGTAVEDRPSDTGAVEGELYYDTATSSFVFKTSTGTETLAG